MKKIILYFLVLVSLASCDFGGVFDNIPAIVFPPESESYEYVIQSGNPYLYFGYAVETVEYKDGTIIAGELEYSVDGSRVSLPGGNAEIAVSTRSITISYPGLEPVVFVSL